MRSRILLAILIVAALPLRGDTRTIFTRAAFDAAFVNVTGDTMTGKLRFINGSEGSPAGDSAAGAGFFFTASAIGITVAGETTTICGVGCAAGSGGTYGWSSTADATGTADLKFTRVGAKQLGWDGSTAGALTHDYTGLTATRIITWPDLAGTVLFTNAAQTITSATWNGTAIGAQYGGTGINSSASTGVTRVSAGTWSADAGILDLASSTSANLASVLSDETGSGASVFAGSPTFTGAPILAAPTATTIQTSGNVGIGVAPSGTNGQRVLITQDGDQNTLATVSNSEAVGTSAFAGLRASADQAMVNVLAHGSGRTVPRWGAAIGGVAEVMSSGADSMAVGPADAVPFILGTGGQGRVFVRPGTQTLTESSATVIADVSLANNTVVGGTLFYTIEANDATDYQVLRGRVDFSAVSKGGTITSTVGTAVEITSTSAASTLTNTTTITNGAAKITLNLNAISSLTQTTLRVSMTIVLDGGTANVTWV